MHNFLHTCVGCAVLFFNYQNLTRSILLKLSKNTVMALYRHHHHYFFKCFSEMFIWCEGTNYRCSEFKSFLYKEKLMFMVKEF